MDAIASVIICVLIFILIVYQPSYIQFIFAHFVFWLHVCYGILVVLSITEVIVAQYGLARFI